MSIILNKEKLATDELRKNALEILEAGLGAIDTEKILRKKIRIENNNLIIQNGNTTESTVVPLPLTRGGVRGEVFFIGIGKCALDGARVIEDILGDYLADGIAFDVKDPSESNLKIIKYRQGTHPLPSEKNVKVTKEILNMVGDLKKNDLVITLISGGGSALFELPMPRLSLENIIEKTKELTAKGADIYELNTARKEMSQVKGGKFARIIAPAQVVSLIFSDVLGNDISVIASGPTVSDMVVNILLVSNRDALEAMKVKATELGFNTKIETEKFSGNASEIGKELALKVAHIQHIGHKSKGCLLFGGETTVRIPQTHGVGGRNQEMALSALLHMPPNSVLVCAASDGWDNTDHAGAIVDAELLQKTKMMGIFPESFLLRGDSYNFFKNISDGAICTGKLGSNVSDLCILLYK